MQIDRVWAMPNKATFTVKPIKELLTQALEIKPEGLVVDPYVRDSAFKSICDATNDLNPKFSATKNMEAGAFIGELPDNSIAFLFFDPPYSPRQVREAYNGVGKKVVEADTQSSFYARVKNIASAKLVPGAIVCSFGWNSNGFGKSRGFELLRVLLVAHGAHIHDTICTIERKL